jgi:hypothetical protein
MKHKMSEKTARRFLARNKNKIARMKVWHGETFTNAFTRRVALCRKVLSASNSNK